MGSTESKVRASSLCRVFISSFHNSVLTASAAMSSDKKQKLGFVHVEVLLRRGDQWGTIGSRWNNGKVSEWPDYKFTATAWTNVTYHFWCVHETR